MAVRPWIQEFSAGYIERGMHLYPKQGDSEPWVNPQDYKRDRTMFMEEPFDDGYLEFGGGEETRAEAEGASYGHAAAN